MAKAYLLLGSNLGEQVDILKSVVSEIESRLGKLLCCSSYYETEPWGFSHNQNFINQVIAIETALQPLELLSNLLKIEQEFGRTRSQKEGYEARTIDIDILFYNSIILNQPELQIPHPRLHLRKFTLIPLAEINSQLLHPILNKTIKELLDICDDKLVVNKIL